MASDDEDTTTWEQTPEEKARIQLELEAVYLESDQAASRLPNPVQTPIVYVTRHHSIYA
jgi:hypothetical protein